ncbi:MAG: AraC family transcriptional regulator [Sphingopyxis sp.]|nr:AraC family transcriptional regulator [Sphingopyxis sp.]
MQQETKSSGTHPLRWREWASQQPLYDSGPTQLNGVIVQRWAGSAARMQQPRLTHHYLTFHEGGAKRVTRSGEGLPTHRDVPLHAVTTVAAGNAYDWTTEGPIAFTHVYIDPQRYHDTIASHRGDVPNIAQFAEVFGRFDPLLCRLLHRLVQRSLVSDTDIMAAEMLVDGILLRLFDSLAAGTETSDRIVLTEANLKRVRDYVAVNLHARIVIDDLAALTGYSRFHFARAFARATGLPPYSYVINQRIAAAQRLLRETDWPIEAVASATGFSSHAQFTTTFRQLTGTTPSRYRGAASHGPVQNP